MLCMPLDRWYLLYMHQNHDDVIKLIHFPRCWPFVRGIHRSAVNSPHKGQWRGVFMFSLICTWINGWINNREAGYLRRLRAHYDVNVHLRCDTKRDIFVFLHPDSAIDLAPKSHNTFAKYPTMHRFNRNMRMFPFDDVIMCDMSLFQPRKSFRSGRRGLPGVPALRLAAEGRDHDTGNVVQCGAVITRSILSQIFTKDTPWLAH